MATSKKTRFFMGFLALLFIVTSSALTIAIVVDGIQNGNRQKQQAEQNAALQKALQQQNNKEEKLDNFTPTSTPQQQLEKIDIKVGDGQEVKPGDTITADYTGALMSNGQVFDASSRHGGPVSFSLSGVIAGWSQGIPGMKVGGTRRLLIPAQLAYGSQGTNGIPPNSDLVFDVTVTKIGK